MGPEGVPPGRVRSPFGIWGIGTPGLDGTIPMFLQQRRSMIIMAILSCASKCSLNSLTKININVKVHTSLHNPFKFIKSDHTLVATKSLVLFCNKVLVYGPDNM